MKKRTREKWTLVQNGGYLTLGQAQGSGGEGPINMQVIILVLGFFVLFCLLSGIFMSDIIFSQFFWDVIDIPLYKFKVYSGMICYMYMLQNDHHCKSN